MNYLAHLHIAEQCNSSLLGNLAADFIRGKPEKQFSPEISQAIYLHRFVDGYIDALPEVKHCRRFFPTELYRFSAIALDITWDHFLARHWEQYHPDSLEKFISNAEMLCQIPDYEPFPQRFITVSQKMWHEGWILSYRDRDTVGFVLERMSTRSPRMASLADCFPTIEKHYSEFESAFPGIYRQTLTAAKSWCENSSDQKMGA
ncbi:ACP phosphodiesterase [Parasalinivibrio latis]|uniref:acyl carrier protein phosphodiesterase n=1 Tax=Parasalinivibrio latis TaxID=2952610 RepID=UPI0030E38B1B